MADFYRSQFATYGVNFDLLPNYPNQLVNPRSQTVSLGAERELLKGLFISGDYVKQRWSNLQRTVDLNAPAAFDRTAPGQTRSVAAANATRPILPVNGGVRQVNVLTNLGIANYDGFTDRNQLSRSFEGLRGRQLHAIEGHEHERAGRQRDRTDPGDRLPPRARGHKVLSSPNAGPKAPADTSGDHTFGRRARRQRLRWTELDQACQKCLQNAGRFGRTREDASSQSNADNHYRLKTFLPAVARHH